MAAHSLRLVDRPGGNSMLSGAVSAEVAEANRRALAQQLGFEDMPRLEHGSRVYQLDDDFDFENRPMADIVITDQPGKLIGVTTADCVALLVYDPVHSAVAAVHSGWRGTRANVIGAALEHMRARFEARAGDLKVYISPAPKRAEYEVGPEVARLFGAKYISQDKNGRYWFDNKLAVYDQLVAGGVSREHIEISSESSFDEKFHSYRRDGKASGRHVAAIGLN